MQVLKNYLIYAFCYGMKIVELFCENCCEGVCENCCEGVCENCCEGVCGSLVERKLDWKLIWLDVLLMVRGERKMLLTGFVLKLLVLCWLLGRLILRPET